MSINVSKAIAPFLNYCEVERHVGRSTSAKYRDCFKSWISRWLGDKDLEQLTKIDILDLRKAMVDKGLSVARQYSVIVCLKSFLRFCRTTLDLNCLDPDEITLPKRPAPEVEYLTEEEIQRMLDAIPLHTFAGLRLRALIEVLLATGMRISEALSSRREVFDADAPEVEIVGKGGRKRTVFLRPRCRYWVRRFMNRRVDDDPAVFVTTGFPASPFKLEDVSRFFIDLRHRAGLTKKLTPHLLRHTFCTILRNNGADISHIKDLAGHANITTTARYYLGKDRAVLRSVVDRYLKYDLRESETHTASTDATGPGSVDTRFDKVAA